MNNLPTSRVTVTLPKPLPRGITCGIHYIDDAPDSIEDVFIAFNQPIHGDDDYFDVFTLETVSDLLTALDEVHDTFDPDNGSWVIDLTYPIEVVW